MTWSSTISGWFGLAVGAQVTEPPPASVSRGFQPEQSSSRGGANDMVAVAIVNIWTGEGTAEDRETIYQRELVDAALARMEALSAIPDRERVSLQELADRVGAFLSQISPGNIRDLLKERRRELAEARLAAEGGFSSQPVEPS